MTRKELADDNRRIGRVEREVAAMPQAVIDTEKYAAIYAAVAEEWADRHGGLPPHAAAAVTLAERDQHRRRDVRQDRLRVLLYARSRVVIAPWQSARSAPRDRVLG